jgi:hypothetical protein
MRVTGAKTAEFCKINDFLFIFIIFSRKTTDGSFSLTTRRRRPADILADIDGGVESV